MAFVQGDGAGRQIVAASYDRAPGRLPRQHDDQVAQVRAPAVKWATAFELWGPITYRVEIDGQAVGTTTSTGLTVPTVVADGLHRWRVVAVDIRGQSTATPSRNLRVDATPPKVTFKVSGSRKRGKQVKVAVQATDASGHGGEGLGAEPRAHRLRRRLADRHRAKAAHRYGHSGKVTVRVSASDKAGNAIALTAADHDPQVAPPGRRPEKRAACGLPFVAPFIAARRGT